MAASKNTVAALSADRVQVVVLGMTLFAEAGILVSAPGAAFAIASTGALGPFGLSVCDCNHRLT